MVIPYLPTARWYAEWYRAMLSGANSEEAVGIANNETGMKGKDFSRCTIHAHGREVVLSVAIEGGAHSLRNRTMLAKASVSPHGNWPHSHLGAIEAAYGRTPMYQHLAPGIAGILTNPPVSLKELSRSLHNLVAGFLPMPDDDSALTDAVRARGEELARTIDPDVSIIDALMRLGEETALALVAFK